MNIGEFFAELSVAYLGNMVEINKVFPRTIEEIDPESRALLKEIWSSLDEATMDVQDLDISATH
jgi:2C-methyl-D-erythritol 2,4-cyclodiphosphate synthase